MLWHSPQTLLFLLLFYSTWPQKSHRVCSDQDFDVLHSTKSFQCKLANGSALLNRFVPDVEDLGDVIQKVIHYHTFWEKVLLREGEMAWSRLRRFTSSENQVPCKMFETLTTWLTPGEVEEEELLRQASLCLWKIENMLLLGDWSVTIRMWICNKSREQQINNQMREHALECTHIYCMCSNNLYTHIYINLFEATQKLKSDYFIILTNVLDESCCSYWSYFLACVCFSCCSLLLSSSTVSSLTSFPDFHFPSRFPQWLRF